MNFFCLKLDSVRKYGWYFFEELYICILKVILTNMC